jgi:malonyl CoA-acyl carrier protein transacylase
MPPTALLFPGQGSHAEGMDEPWRDHPLMARGLDVLGFDPFARLHEGTAMQQPALLLCSLCAWSEEGGEATDADAAAGHSLGEYAALVAAGGLAFDDAVALVAERGAAMDAAAREQPGGMLALLGGEDHAVRGLATRFGLTVANDNAPGQLVLSGALDAILAAEEAAKEATGARARRLDVAGAFHSPLMAPAAERLAAALDRTPFGPARLPVYANGTAAPFTDPRRELAAHLLQPVRWRETLLALRAAGIERFVELGPGAVLTGLVKRTLGLRGEQRDQVAR